MGQLKRDNKNEVGVPIFLDCCCGLNLVDRKASPPGFVRPQIGGPFSQSHSKNTVFYLAHFVLNFTIIEHTKYYYSMGEIVYKRIKDEIKLKTCSVYDPSP